MFFIELAKAPVITGLWRDLIHFIIITILCFGFALLFSTYYVLTKPVRILILSGGMLKAKNIPYFSTMHLFPGVSNHVR